MKVKVNPPVQKLDYNHTYGHGSHTITPPLHVTQNGGREAAW